MNDCKWQFDKTFLLKKIKEFKIKLLNSQNLTNDEVDELQSAIKEFTLFLNALEKKRMPIREENHFISNLQEVDLEILKPLFLQKSKRDYNKIGNELIKFVISLSEKNIVTLDKHESYIKYVMPDEIINTTLKIYDSYLPDLSGQARFIINNKNNLINFSLESFIESECFYICQLPFINVCEYQKNPYDFIHELQHGIEKTLNYNTHLYFKEVGPILLETLYIDYLVNSNDENAATLYFHRINECSYILEYLNKYFNCILELQKFNFNVDMPKFIEILKKNKLFDSKRANIVNILCESDIYELLMYLLSFLKSLELRNVFYQNKNEGFKLLNGLLNSKENIVLNINDISLNYENYLLEICQKMNSKKRTKKKS